jgi:phosphonate transport system substrate-binding protein
MPAKIFNIVLEPVPRINDYCTFRYIILILFAVFCSKNIEAQNRPETENNEAYGVAFLRTMFINVDYNDAKASIKVYVDNLQKELLSGFSMRPVYFEDTNDLLKNYSKENLAVITLSSIDYLAYKSKLSLCPMLVSSGKSDPLETYLILVRKDENITNIETLSDKRIGMLQRENDPIPVMWLNVLLGNSKIKSKEKSFGKMIIDNSESQLILSLFFGQLDACLVSKTAFETMSEINPQINNRLIIFKYSPGYLKAVSSFTNNFKKSKYSDSLLRHLTSLDTYPAGRQLFTLTKTAKIILFKDEYLDNVRILVADYNKLQKHWIK